MYTNSCTNDFRTQRIAGYYDLAIIIGDLYGCLRGWRLAAVFSLYRSTSHWEYQQPLGLTDLTSPGGRQGQPGECSYFAD